MRYLRLVEAVGLGLIELAPGLALALTGAALTGLGYSLSTPGLVSKPFAGCRRTAAASPWAPTRHSSMWRLGSARRLSVCSRDVAGLSAVFLASAVAALCAAPIAASFLRSSPAQQHPRSIRLGEQLQVHRQELDMKLPATAALASLALIGSSAQAQETNMTRARPSREDIRASHPHSKVHARPSVRGRVEASWSQCARPASSPLRH